MKIAIDKGPLASGDSIRGIGTYVGEITRHLKNVDVVDLSKSDLSKYDIVHFTRFHPFFICLPFSKPKGTKFVLTIYDLIPLIYPKHYPPGIRGWLKWQINKFLIRKNVDAVITISETSKKDICRFIGIDPRKVFVTYLAPRPIFKNLETPARPAGGGNWKLEVKKRYGLPNRFALYVGDINYNKNISSLIKACRIAKIPLVISGKQAVDVENMDLSHAELKHLKNIDWTGVTRLGYISDEDLCSVYNLASVYVQPSFYEGFGLPMVEAFACGTPVVASKTQALVEIGDGGPLYADAGSPAEMAEKIKNILDDPKQKKTATDNGLKRAKEFSWDATARKTQEVYEKA